MVKKLLKIETYERVTSDGVVFREFEFVRFIALLPVVLTHLNTQFIRVFFNSSSEFNDNLLFKLITNGDAGLMMFFMLSGLILARPFGNHFIFYHKKVNLKKYYTRRLTRIEPPYLIALTTFTILFIFFDNKYTNIEILLRYIASFFYNFRYFFGIWNPADPPIWSLEVEVQFYLIVPLLAYVFFIKNKYLRIISIVSLIFLTDYFSNKFYIRIPFLNLLPFYIRYFFVGFLIYEIVKSDLLNGKVTKHYFFDILFFIGLYLYLNQDINFFTNIPVLGNRLLICGFLIIIGSLKGKLIKGITNNKYFYTIGGMSYTIYLIHYPLLFMIVKYISLFYVPSSYYEAWLYLGIPIFFLILIISALLFLLIEKPFMRKNWIKEGLKFG